MGLGLQIVLEKEGRFLKVFGSARVDESRHRDGKLAREEDVYGKGQMARGGEGEGLREGEGVSQLIGGWGGGLGGVKYLTAREGTYGWKLVPGAGVVG